MDNWPELQRLAYEKEIAGFYLTGHPLESVAAELELMTDFRLDRLGEALNGQVVRVGGLVAAYREHKTKKGERMAFVVLEDLSGKVDLTVFPSLFARYDSLLTSDQPLIVVANVEQAEEGPKLTAEDIRTLPDALEHSCEQLVLRLPAERLARERLAGLKDLFFQHHGGVAVQLVLDLEVEIGRASCRERV